MSAPSHQQSARVLFDQLVVHVTRERAKAPRRDIAGQWRQARHGAQRLDPTQQGVMTPCMHGGLRVAHGQPNQTLTGARRAVINTELEVIRSPAAGYYFRFYTGVPVVTHLACSGWPEIKALTAL